LKRALAEYIYYRSFHAEISDLSWRYNYIHAWRRTT